jgi:hypothetical protein
LNADRISELEKQLARANSEIERLEEQSRNIQRREDWASSRWLRPLPMLLLLGVSVLLNWLAAAYSKTVVPVLLLRSFSIVCFMLWSIAVYYHLGMKQLIVRWFIWGTGWAVVVWWLVSLAAGLSLTVKQFLGTVMIEPGDWWAASILHETYQIKELGIIATVLIVIVFVNLFGSSPRSRP